MKNLRPENSSPQNEDQILKALKTDIEFAYSQYERGEVTDFDPDAIRVASRERFRTKQLKARGNS